MALGRPRRPIGALLAPCLRHLLCCSPTHLQCVRSAARRFLDLGRRCRRMTRDPSPASPVRYRLSTSKRIPVRSSPSIEMSMKAGMQTRSKPPGATYPREMAIALTAWLMAPAPIAWTSTRPLLRITPAMAPATATGLEVAETFRTSTGARSAVIVAGTPSNVFTIDSLDGRCSASGATNGNQYRIESHGSGGNHEPVGHPGQEALEHGVLVHPDTAVSRAHHSDVSDIGRAARKHPGVCCRDV